MNIFVLDSNPFSAAEMLCDKHVPKMIVESAQMLASAAITHGATARELPRTQKGTPYKGGYKNHPCTVWASVNNSNYDWLTRHAVGLCDQFQKRFGKTHSCAGPIVLLSSLRRLLPAGSLTTFAQAMPDQHRNPNTVFAYRNYYRTKKFAAWNRGTTPPKWW